MRKYQNTHGDPKKGVIPTKVNGHPAFENSLLLNKKENKYFQKIIGVCQLLIVVGRFDL